MHVILGLEINKMTSLRVFDFRFVRIKEFMELHHASVLKNKLMCFLCFCVFVFFLLNGGCYTHLAHCLVKNLANPFVSFESWVPVAAYRKLQHTWLISSTVTNGSKTLIML
jgi:hypothetical protein